MQKVSEIRVRYAETDAMGIVYHANYLVWMEIARTELFRLLGLPYTQFESEGLALAVVDAALRYKAPAKYDDLLELHAEVTEVSSRKVVFSYKVLRGDVLLCEGETVHLFVNQDGRAVSAGGFPILQNVKRIFDL